MDVDNTYDIVVIGGGLSGLTAAWTLKKRDQDLKILVLEAKDRLGGRTLTETLPTIHGTDEWDIGGQWISSSHRNMLELLSELNLEIYPQYVRGKKLLQLTGEPIKSYSGSIPDMSIPTLLDLENSLQKVDKLSEAMDVDRPFSHPQADLLDSSTLEALGNNFFWTDGASRMMDLSVEAVYGASSRQISSLYFLMYSRSAGGYRRLIETTKNSAQELRVKGGTQQISKILAKKLGDENVRINTPVVSIDQNEDGVIVTTLHNETVRCKRVVIAIPVPQNAHIRFNPLLPATKTLLHRNMPMGNLVKFVAVYEKPFWREKGYSGEIVNEGKTADSYEPVDVVYDATTANGNAALVGFMSAQRGLYWSEAKMDVRRITILETLARFLGEEALKPISYLEKNWYDEPYNGGCPAAICGPGIMSHYHQLKSQFGNLHWCGTETSTVWMGYMEGAVESGKRVALEVIRVIRPDLLTEQELVSSANSKNLPRRKSQPVKPDHKVFRYTIGLALVAVGIAIFKKFYFRIAL